MAWSSTPAPSLGKDLAELLREVTDGVVPDCDPQLNSTEELFRCLVRSHMLGDTMMENDNPTPQADLEAIDHLNEMKELHKKRRNFNDPTTAHFVKVLKGMGGEGAGGLPRVYAFQGGDWPKPCDGMEMNLGYRYSLEHWLRQVVLNLSSRVYDVDEADYVYLPFCMAGMLLHLAAKAVLDFQRVMEPSPTQLREREHREQREQREPQGRSVDRPPPVVPTPLRRSNASAAAAMAARSDQNLNWQSGLLEYEGNLPARAVTKTLRSYLLPLVTVWQQDPNFQRCLQRKGCSFLFVSSYGRHVWHDLASQFGDKAVFVTHGSLTSWPARQKRRFFLHSRDAAGNRTFSRSRRWRTSCGSVCEEHCRRDPPAVLPTDIVVPWIVAYQWTPRAETSRHRDILAFYSGSQNSCSREQLTSLFAGSFVRQLKRWTSQRSRPAMPARRANRRGRHEPTILVFPHQFRLRQEDWSELAMRSELCLVPDGDTPDTGRLVEVIMHGCVPLIISDRLRPPFFEYLDWSKFAFWLREESLRDLPRLLRYLFGTPRGLNLIAERRRYLGDVAHLFDYNHEGLLLLLLTQLRERSQELRRLRRRDLAQQ